MLNAPGRPLPGGAPYGGTLRPAEFGPDVWVGAHCLIQRGVTLGASVVVDDGCRIEAGATVEARTLVTYRAHVCADTHVGPDCVIGGFIGERATVGSHSRVFGSIVHQHLDPTRPWDAPASMEPAATVHDHVMIGFGALITRDVSIGPASYVCAGAIVSRDVPPQHIAYGVNELCPAGDWRGPLNTSALFHVKGPA